MNRWQTNLVDVRNRRRAALVAGDIETLRKMLFRSALFAGLTVQTITSVAERDFEEFVETGNITNPFLRTQRMNRIESLRKFVDALELADFERYIEDASGWTLAEDIESNVFGLGCAKSSFSSALFGGTDTYCLDVWGTRFAAIVVGLVDGDPDEYKNSYRKVRGDDVRNHPNGCECNVHRAEWLRSNFNGRKDRWSLYRAIGDATFGDAAGQWSFFESADPTFAATGHDAFFRHVL